MTIINLSATRDMKIKLSILTSNLDLPYSGAIIDEKSSKDFANYLTDNSNPQGHSKITAL